MSDRFDQHLENEGIRFGYPRIMGAYLAVNAVPDLWMLVDSADCATLRAEFIQDNHDWNSTLLSEDGRHRIANTGVCPSKIIHDRRQDIKDQMVAIGQGEGRYLIPYAAPIAALVGVDYQVLYEEIRDRINMDLLPVRPVEALGDWVSGYLQIIEALAEHLPLSPGPREDRNVAIVGYLWDRNEADHGANVAELKRLLSLLGLNLVSVWLSGSPTDELAAIGTASTVISLPYGRSVARLVAGRTGATVVDTDLPVGLAATMAWLRQVGDATGSWTAARRTVEEEAGVHYRAVSKAVVRYILNREFMIATEGYLAAAVAAMVREMGGLIRLVATSGLQPDFGDLGPGAQFMHGPPLNSLGKSIREIFNRSTTVPVLICNEQAVGTIRTIPLAGVFLGFQSPGAHHLFDAPFMGFRGALCLTDKIVNSIPIAFTLHR
jgi:nitrogenase molybdenum-iron protein alpha/beta subunit